MLLNILLSIVCLAAVVFSILLLSPLQVETRLGFTDGRLQGKSACSFIHPRVCAFRFDFFTRSGRLSVFGKKIGGSSRTEDTPASASGDSRGDEIVGSGPEPTEKPETKHVGAPAQRDVTPVHPAIIGEMEKPAGSHEEKRSAELPAEIAEISGPAPETAAHHVSGKIPDETIVRKISGEKQDKGGKKRKRKEFEGKRESRLQRLSRNPVLFFLKNGAWRGKIIRWILRVLSSLFRIIRFDRFGLALRAGVENPMIVGTVFGFHRAFISTLPERERSAVLFEPVFMENRLEGSFHFRTVTSLFRLMLPALVALFTFPLFHTLWLLLRLYLNERRRKRLAMA